MRRKIALPTTPEKERRKYAIRRALERQPLPPVHKREWFKTLTLIESLPITEEQIHRHYRLLTISAGDDTAKKSKITEAYLEAMAYLDYQTTKKELESM